MKRIIVAGALANKCGHGGEAWVRLGWIIGLRELGCDVRFVEQIARESCVDAAGQMARFSDSVNRAWFERVVADYDLSGMATLIYDDGAEFSGPGADELRAFAADADLLVNIGGHLTYPPVFNEVTRRAYVDIDPGFTQFWHAQGNPGGRLAGHDSYFTVGKNIGSPDCQIPTGGFHWQTMHRPVVLSRWPASFTPRFDRFTTVASWRGPFGPIEYGGETFGLKVHEFRKFISLPRRTALPFEIALNIHPSDAKDRDALLKMGWRLTDPAVVAGTPGDFRAYIQGSSAEFSVAQGIYTQTRSGWFSDRTVRYLASGKPALVQNTGFELPSGEGLVAFNTLEDAVAGAGDIVANYPRHCRAARDLAEQYFDSRKVLAHFLQLATNPNKP